MSQNTPIVQRGASLSSDITCGVGFYVYHHPVNARQVPLGSGYAGSGMRSSENTPSMTLGELIVRIP
jgi:hypothetical protein